MSASVSANKERKAVISSPRYVTLRARRQLDGSSKLQNRFTKNLVTVELLWGGPIDRSYRLTSQVFRQT